MSVPTKEQLDLLAKFKKEDDHDGYHRAFDQILEDKLSALDEEFMKAMTREYEKSQMARG